MIIVNSDITWSIHSFSMRHNIWFYFCLIGFIDTFIRFKLVSLIILGLSVLGDVLEVRFVGCAGALGVLLAVVLRRFENVFHLLFAEIVVDVVAPATSWCVESLGGFANGFDVLSKRLIVKEIKVAKVVQIRVYSLKSEDASVSVGVEVGRSLVWILLFACWSILPESLALF